jgi:hypothetical protein
VQFASAPADALRSRGAFGEHGVPGAEGTAAAAEHLFVPKDDGLERHTEHALSLEPAIFSQHLLGKLHERRLALNDSYRPFAYAWVKGRETPARPLTITTIQCAAGALLLAPVALAVEGSR